jgi:hypothetical protein
LERIRSANKRKRWEQCPDEAQKSAAGVVGDAVDAPQDVYDSASNAARKTAGSFEPVLKNTIKTQPYTVVAIALGIGWLLPNASTALTRNLA